jgi:hypothetical protein
MIALPSEPQPDRKIIFGYDRDPYIWDFRGVPPAVVTAFLAGACSFLDDVDCRQLEWRAYA